MHDPGWERGRDVLKRVLTNRYLAFIAFLLLYTWLMSRLGGMPPLLWAWRSEIPFLLYIYFYFNSITLPTKWQPVVTAAVVVAVYACFDISYLQLGRPPRVVEVRQLPELLAVVPYWAIIAALIGVGFPIAAFIGLLRFRKFSKTVLGAVPLVVVIMTAEFAPAYFLDAFKTVQRPVTTWSDIQSAQDIGRIWMLLYHEAKRRLNMRLISDYRDDPAFLKEMEDTVAALSSVEKKHNVHLVVLESFLDPSLLRDASFSRMPMHPEFAKLSDNRGSISIAPLFGGGTAQAEFEVLCGVPAMRKLSGIDFDVFTGAETYCLPAVLAKGGYHTISTNAYKPSFFNSINAYQSLGFQKSYYPEEYAMGRETYLSTGDVTAEHYMFDGTLLEQNLAFVSRWISANPGVPLFNYVISIYGHLPYLLDAVKRPEVIDVAGAVEDRALERSVNQFYYRTEALATYLNALKVVDPESLVILISDHLPPLSGPQTYRKMGYAGGDADYMVINRVFFFENGRIVHHSDIHHYDIPDIILDYISGGSHCRESACNFKPGSVPAAMKNYAQAYMTIMANGMR